MTIRCMAASLLALALIANYSHVASAQEQNGTLKAPEDGTSEEALPGLRQPGDDVSPALNNPVTVADEKKTESLAAYMEAVAAQKNGKLNDALKAFQRAEDADPTAAEPVKAHAMLLMRLGRIKQAGQKARRAIELDADDYETRVQLAILLLAEQQNPAEAVRLIEEGLNSKKLNEKSKEFIDIHSVRGRLYIQARDAANAAQSYLVILDALEKPEDYELDFREHQRLMTDRVTGYDTVGKIMLEVGRNDDAIRAFSALARVNEDRPDDHHYWLSLAHFRKDNLKECETNLNRYFASNKRSLESLRLLSDLYETTSRSGETVDRLRALGKDTTDASRVELFIGNLLVEKGDGDGAAKVFQNVITDSGDADGYLGLIRVAVVQQNAPLLLEYVSKALRARIQIEELFPFRLLITNDPDFGRSVIDASINSLDDVSIEQHPAATFFYSQLADADYLNLPEQEGVLLQATLDQNPGPALGIEAMGRLGMNQYLQDKYDDASETFRRLLSLPGLPEGDRINTLYRLSAVEADNEKYDEAITAIQTALKLRPDFPQLMYQLGLIQLQADKHSESEETLKATIKLSASDPRLSGQSRLLLGSLYSRGRRWIDAVEVYKALLETPDITPETARRGRSGLSNAYVQAGDLPNGEKILEEVYAEDPDDPGVNNDLGYLYADQNKNLEQAEKMIRIATEAEPDNPAYLDSLGWVLHRRGKNEEAVQALTKATSDPEYRDTTIIEHLGDVQKALNRDDDAIKSWQEALKVEQESSAPDQDIINRLTGKLGPEKSADKPTE